MGIVYRAVNSVKGFGIIPPNEQDTGTRHQDRGLIVIFPVLTPIAMLLMIKIVQGFNTIGNREQRVTITLELDEEESRRLFMGLVPPGF